MSSPLDPADPERAALAAWYEQAHARDMAVVSGAVPRPDAGEWEEFVQQVEWAAARLGVTSPSSASVAQEQQETAPTEPTNGDPSAS